MGTLFTVVLTQAAKDDIDQIRSYLLANRSAEVENELIDTFHAAFESLETFPVRGVVPKELDVLGERNFRQLNLGPYRLIYYIVETTVSIMLVVDGWRDLLELLARRLLRR